MMVKMGENSVNPQENGLEHPKEENPDVEMPEEDEESEEDLSPEEIAKLDSQLDELNNALDDIEQKNDNIHARLLELLHSSREIRQELKSEDAASPNGPADS